MNEVSKLHQIQQELAETQDNNWKIIENQFAVFQNNIHLLRDCTQLLFSRQQMNFNYDTMTALLTMTHTNIKAYRSALYAYQLNIMNAIPTILGQFLPMSLVPRQSLLKVLEEVIIEQGQADDRLTLAIPPKEILAYYEAKLLIDVITLEEGLLMTLSIPLASKQTSLTVYRATPIPMPQPEPTLAMKWKTETQFLAISEDNLETALLTEYDLANCIGSATYQICHRSIATERGHGSCLATLFFKGSLESIQKCETEVIELPATEKAENLGYGVWLVTSATKAYTLYETTSDSNTATGLTKYPGCNICIITLACGKQLTGPHITIRSDLQTCKSIPAIKIHVNLPDPLKHLLSEVPPVDEMPYFPTKSAAGVQMLTEIRQKLLTSPKLESTDKLMEIARPITSKMRSLRPTLQDELSSYSTWKTSIGMSIVSFFGSMILHFIFMFFYHKCKTCQKYAPDHMLKFNAGTNASTDIEQRETDTTITRRRGSTGDTLAPAQYTLPAPLYEIEK